MMEPWRYALRFVLLGTLTIGTAFVLTVSIGVI